jgi:hypothetical protein
MGNRNPAFSCSEVLRDTQLHLRNLCQKGITGYFGYFEGKGCELTIDNEVLQSI